MPTIRNDSVDTLGGVAVVIAIVAFAIVWKIHQGGLERKRGILPERAESRTGRVFQVNLFDS